MRNQYKLGDAIRRWVANPHVGVGPSERKSIAESLDLAILFREECEELLRQILAAHKQIRHVDDAEYFEPLSPDRVVELLAKPFSRRSDAELESMPIERLAMNPIAIDQLFEHLAEEPLSAEWQEIHDEECDHIARKDGIGWLKLKVDVNGAGVSVSQVDEIDRQDEIGWSELEDDAHGGENSGSPMAEFVGASRTADNDEGEFLSELPAIRLHVSAVDPAILWEQGGPQDVRAKYLDVEIQVEKENPRRLRIRTGGIAYVSPGCRMQLRWLTDERGGVNAEASCEADNEIVLDASPGGKALLVTQHKLEIRFACMSPAYAFVACLPIRYQEK